MWNRTRKPEALKPANAVGRHHSAWHAVSITVGRSCCNAVRAFQGSRFLSGEAPRLPIAECAMKESCQCAYKHHADRRGPPRRREELFGLRRAQYVGDERRSMLCRRKTDER